MDAVPLLHGCKDSTRQLSTPELVRKSADRGIRAGMRTGFRPGLLRGGGRNPWRQAELPSTAMVRHGRPGTLEMLML